MVPLELEKVSGSVLLTTIQSSLNGIASTIYAIAGELGLEVYTLSLASSMCVCPFHSPYFILIQKLTGLMTPTFSVLSSPHPNTPFFSSKILIVHSRLHETLLNLLKEPTHGCTALPLWRPGDLV